MNRIKYINNKTNNSVKLIFKSTQIIKQNDYNEYITSIIKPIIQLIYNNIITYLYVKQTNSDESEKEDNRLYDYYSVN